MQTYCCLFVPLLGIIYQRWNNSTYQKLYRLPEFRMHVHWQEFRLSVNPLLLLYLLAQHQQQSLHQQLLPPQVKAPALHLILAVLTRPVLVGNLALLKRSPD